MRYLSASALAVVLLALDFPALAQIGQPYPPGGYPPGGYPPGRRGTIGSGIPRLPRRGKKEKATAKESPEPLLQIAGTLRTIEDTYVVVEARDTRILTLRRTEKTRFLKDHKEIKPAELKPGDHLLVESKKDPDGFLFAVNVIFQKEGTSQERAAASEPVEVLKRDTTDEDERPILRKKGAPAEAEPEDAQPVTAVVRPLPENDEDPVPVLRRRKPGERTPPPPPREVASAPEPEGSAK